MATFILPSVPSVNAQAFSTEQQTSLDSLKQTLIDLLLQQISALQAQIQELVAKQAETTQTVTDLNTQLVESKTEVQTAPILGSTQPEMTVEVGEPYCYTPDSSGINLRIPLTLPSSGWEYAQVYVVPDVKKSGIGYQDPATQHGGKTYTREYALAHNSIVNISATANMGTSTVTVQLGKNRKDKGSLTPITQHTLTSVVYLANPCQ